ERDLLECYEPSWVGPLPELLSDWPGRRIYRRGFVEHVELTADEWLRHGADVLRHCPALRSLTLSGINGRLPDLARSPGLDGIAELHLETRQFFHGECRPWHRYHSYRALTEDSDWDALLGWPHPHHVLFVRMGSRRYDARYHALAASPVLG